MAAVGLLSDQGARDGAQALVRLGSIKFTTAKRPCSNVKLAAALTCLQLTFALYATSVLYFRSPSVKFMTGPHHEAYQTTRQWRDLQDPYTARIRDEHTKEVVCESEDIVNFRHKDVTDSREGRIKTDLFQSILEFQKQKGGAETLDELLALPSTTRSSSGLPTSAPAKITVILNHFKPRTLCSQLDALLNQTLPFHSLWVLALGSPREDYLRRIAQSYNDSRISFMGCSHHFKYYGRFQLALQAPGADFIYILDDDMIPGRRMLQILAHVAGTDKYHNSVLGSIGRILPFRQKDKTFPSYRGLSNSREAGLYLPDPAYSILVERILQVDYLCSSWFLPRHLVNTLFVETPFTFETGEDLHLSYQLQKYRDAHSYVLPIDPSDQDTWGDRDHHLAYVDGTTGYREMVIRDKQWWRALSRGYITQWATMHPQQNDALFFANSVDEVTALAPLILKLRRTTENGVLLVVTGGQHCACQDAAAALGWSPSSCHRRRFNILDLEVGSIAPSNHDAEIPVIQEVYAGMKGLLQIHSPAMVFTVAYMAPHVRDALAMAITKLQKVPALIQLPRSALPHALWIADIKPAALQQWNRMKISVNIITQNRPSSLLRLLNSLQDSMYLGDEVPLSFNIDSGADAETLRLSHSFPWQHGPKAVRRRVAPGGLIRAVSESWYPESDDEFGVLLEDDVEVSPFFYIWLKYTLLAYHYNPEVTLPELNAIALYTPRIVEVVEALQWPRWNGTDFFNSTTPYLHQLPCSWGALFLPRPWRAFCSYMGERFTEEPEQSPMRIPRSRTNWWRASWKKFLIELMYLRGYVTLYPNFPNQASLSTNHMEPGVHIGAGRNDSRHQVEDYEVPLLDKDFVPSLPQARLPPAPDRFVLDQSWRSRLPEPASGRMSSLAAATRWSWKIMPPASRCATPPSNVVHLFFV